MKQKSLRIMTTRAGKSVGILAIASVFAVSAIFAPRLVDAQTNYEQQIKKLQQENNRSKEVLSALTESAASYESAIAQLQGQIAQLQRDISKNEAEKAALEQEIAELQVELERQKNVLGQNIKAMYVNGEMSTLEMLATSKDLSEFVDKEAYRNAVQKKIQDTLEKIAVLQNELNTKKQEIEAILVSLQSKRQTVEAARAEQSRLLAMNQQQQSEYSAKMKSNNAKIAKLKQLQAEENCRIFGCGGGVTGGGGYPWGYAKCLHTGQVEGSCYNYDWAVNGNPYNYLGSYPGGWGFRNCTDWVAFRSGGRVPSAATIAEHSSANGGAYSGNAKWWDDAGRHMGKRVSSSPQAGDAAISNWGNYGHVMYVESVSSDSITISDYNRAGTGKYDTSTFTKVGEGVYRTPTGRTYELTFVSF